MHTSMNLRLKEPFPGFPDSGCKSVQVIVS